MSEDRSSWVFKEERFDNPPKLVYGGINTPSKTILQTNPQHFKYHWGRAELVHFEGLKAQLADANITTGKDKKRHAISFVFLGSEYECRQP